VNARDELAEFLGSFMLDDRPVSIAVIANSIISNGYVKPRTIATFAELEALPVGSVLLDAQGWVAVILPTVDGQHCVRLAKAGDNLWALNSLVAQRMLPATVLHEPEAQP